MQEVYTNSHTRPARYGGIFVILPSFAKHPLLRRMAVSGRCFSI
jgi:hypothetical protein